MCLIGQVSFGLFYAGFGIGLQGGHGQVLCISVPTGGIQGQAEEYPQEPAERKVHNWKDHTFNLWFQAELATQAANACAAGVGSNS